MTDDILTLAQQVKAESRRPIRSPHRASAFGEDELHALAQAVIDLHACYLSAKIDRNRDLELLDRAEAAERARDEARRTIKDALDSLLRNEHINNAVEILAAANVGLQPGESNLENPQGPTVSGTRGCKHQPRCRDAQSCFERTMEYRR